MKTRIMAMTVLVVMLALPGALYAQETDPESVIRAIIEAINDKNVDDALALVADDAVITIVPPPPGITGVFTGKEEIRERYEMYVAHNEYTELSNFEVRGDKATWSAKVSADEFRALGLASLDFNAEGIVQGGLLKSYTFTMTDCALAMLEGAIALEQNKAIARRYIEELWTKGDLAVADELIAADFVDHSPAPGVTPDREGIKQGVTAFQTGFSDFQFIIEDLIAEGDKVVIPQTFRGTHTGEFAGAPATGKEITMTVIVILRIEGGKIVDRWANVDELGFLIQLGVIPPPGEGGE